MIHMLQVDAAGFTLAPLQPQFRDSGSNISQSCLVTFVLKVDLGGFLSDNSTFGLLLSPFSQRAADTFLHPMLTSIMALRDTVIFIPRRPPFSSPSPQHTRALTELCMSCAQKLSPQSYIPRTPAN